MQQKIFYARIFLFIIVSILVFCVSNLYINSAGAYSKELNISMVFPKEYDYLSTLKVSAHEAGHYIYFKKMYQEERDEYQKIFNNSNEFVSDYAKKNAEEDFAEMVKEMTVCTISTDRIMGEDVNKQKFFQQYFQVFEQ